MSNAPYLLERARARASHGPRPRRRFDVPRRAGGRLRQGPPDGDLRRGLRSSLSVHPRGAGRLRAALAGAREAGDARGRLRRGDRAGHDQVRQGRDDRRRGRAAAQGAAGEDPVAQARLPRRRHGHRRQFELDLRRRGGARPDAPERSGPARPSRRWRPSSPTRPTPPSRRISPPRRSARCESCSTRCGWSADFGRSLRDQRGLRRGGDGGDARSFPSRTTRSTSTAAPARSAIPSAPPARASW